MVAAASPSEEATSPRILIVEDNFLVANSLAHSLQSMGCEVVGPAPTVKKGLQLVQENNLHGAILDINIIGGTSAPIAMELHKRRIPFFFITGYASPQMLPTPLTEIRKLRKPIDDSALATVVEEHFGEL